MNKIDLHIHTNNSLDADFTPKEIIEMAKVASLEIIAIADHDTTMGVETAIDIGVANNIKVIPSIEISCVYDEIELHILAYNINLKNPQYNLLLDNVMKQERAASQKRLELIKDLGIYVNMEKLNSLIVDGVIIGEIIGEASINEPENKDNPLIKPFLNGGTLSDNPYVNFYWEFCAQNKPAYVPITFPPLSEIISLIKNDNGLVIFAHPGNNIKEDKKLLYEIMHMGLDGLEAYSSYHSPEQTEFFLNHAEMNNWIITCGSDFHGKNKPKIKLGEINIREDHEEKLIKLFN